MKRVTISLPAMEAVMLAAILRKQKQKKILLLKLVDVIRGEYKNIQD